MNPLNATFINTATTTTLKTGRGHLGRVVIGTTAAGLITIYDNTAGSGTVLAEFKVSINEGSYPIECRFQTGLTVVTAAASHLTVTWE